MIKSLAITKSNEFLAFATEEYVVVERSAMIDLLAKSLLI